VEEIQSGGTETNWMYINMLMQRTGREQMLLLSATRARRKNWRTTVWSTSPQYLGM